MTLPANSSVASLRIGGRAVPLVTKPGCKVCRSQKRLEIEEQMLRGLPPSTIIDGLQNAEDLTVRNLTDHFRRHLPVEAEGVQRFLDDEAATRLPDLDDAADHVRSAHHFLRAVVERVQADMDSGRLSPSVADALKAQAVLSKAEDQAPQLDMEAFRSIVNRTLDVFRSHVDNGTFQAVLSELSHDELIMELAAGEDQPGRSGA